MKNDIVVTDAEVDAELKTAVEVGETTGVRSEWYQPLDEAGRWFAALSGSARTFDTVVAVDGAGNASAPSLGTTVTVGSKTTGRK